jgi:xylan 1,4-beta-xylosidase
MKIEINRQGQTVKTDFAWQMGLGNDHAYQLHRQDVLEQVKLAHDELGIKYLRFHGILDDDMLVWQKLSDYFRFRVMPHSKQIQEINFNQVALILSSLLKTGVKPFLELSFMPSALAKGKKQGLRYPNNITPPKKMEEWSKFIKKFISFLVEYFGKEEVESWYIEVWNEPDLNGFFHGSQEDYFRLYSATAQAIKEIDPKLRVGGPSTSACRWIDDFNSYCQANHVPCDFVSTHHYPGDGFGNNITLKDSKRMMDYAKYAAENNVSLSDAIQGLFFRPEVYAKWPKGLLTDFDQKTRAKVKDVPFFITEWNSSAVFGSAVHDEKSSASFIIKTVMDSSGLTQGYMFWCCSDIFEELFMLNKPFHGGYGIINNDGIPKPNFWAFKILSMLYPDRLVAPRTDADVEYAAFISGKDTQALVYSQDNDYYKDQEQEVEITVNAEASSVKAFFIDNDHCNPKRLWKEMGGKDYLLPDQVEEIKAKSKLKGEDIPFESQKGQTAIKLKIRTHDVVLLEFVGKGE